MEDNVLVGGLGDAVSRVLRDSEKSVRSFGYEDTFIPHGSVAELASDFGLTFEEIFSYLMECHARG